MNIQLALNILKDHGIEAHIEGDKVKAQHVYCLNGKAYAEWVTLAPTVEALRDFLNY